MDESDTSKSDAEDAEYIPEGDVTSSEVSEGEDEGSSKPPGLNKEAGGDLGGELKEDKERIEALWDTFKQETRAPAQPLSEPTSKASVERRREDENRTVAIKKTYDFAGEEVVVEEEVAADSKQAKKLFGEDFGGKGKATATPTASKPVGAKRKGGGVGSVLEMLNKKPKMSTLEKSRLDWMKYRQQEGLEDQLEQNKKDGYLEKQDFLKRSEMKQFELERELRMKRFGK